MGWSGSSQSFSQLLGRVEDRIRDAFCPLCGHDHGSLDVLREQVEKQRVLDAAAELRRKLGLLREDGEELERSLGGSTGANVAAQSGEREELREEREAREARITGFVDAVGKVGIAPEEPAVASRELNDRWTRERDNVVEMERMGATSQMEVEGARTTITELDQEIGEGEKTIAEMERDLRELPGRGRTTSR